jgi:hypothetical protein
MTIKPTPARSAIAAFVVTFALLQPALAQEGDGIDINMDALRNRPKQAAPEPPPPPPPVAKPAPAVGEAPAKVPRRWTGKSITLLFEGTDPALPAAAKRQLDSIAAQAADTTQRLELMSYSGTATQRASDVRRLALQRAIAVRGYLMGKGMDGSRIALRPQGPAAAGDQPERIDIRFQDE